MKVNIEYDNEWYPVTDAIFEDEDVFDIFEEEYATEVPDAQAEKWKRVFREFSEVQREMDALRSSVGG